MSQSSVACFICHQDIGEPEASVINCLGSISREHRLKWVKAGELRPCSYNVSSGFPILTDRLLCLRKRQEPAVRRPTLVKPIPERCKNRAPGAGLELFSAVCSPPPDSPKDRVPRRTIAPTPTGLLICVLLSARGLYHP